MAITSTAVWRVRAGGNALNGAAYNPAITGGTDYTQQDAAQATFTSVLSTSAANSTTLVNSANTFTSAMVGNAIKLASGTNAIAGFYFITAYASAGSVTLDRTPATAGALAAGTGRLGGATNSVETITASSLSAGQCIVPGNTVYIRGGGSDSPASNDYVPSGGYVNLSNGSGVAGLHVNYISENGRARFGGNNFVMFNLDYANWLGFMFVAGGTVGANGQCILNGSHGIIRNCVFDQGGYDTSLLQFDYSCVIGCEFFSSSTVAGTPTSIALQIGHDVQVSFCNFHDLGAGALLLNTDYTHAVFYNLITNCGGDAIAAGTSASYTGIIHIIGNTLAGNTGHGINFPMTTQDQIKNVNLHSNLIANHNGSGKSGILFGGTLATNDAYAYFLDGNTFYNNATNITGASIGGSSVVLGSDPFTASSSGDYSLVSGQIGQAPFPRLLTPAAGNPGQFNQHRSGRTAVRSYVDPGAAQRAPIPGPTTLMTS